MSDLEPALPQSGLKRLRLDLRYDGSDFHGWAAQPGLRTVQGVLEASIALVLRVQLPAHTVVAGRTDAGVHAAGQVCHLDLPAAALASAAALATAAGPAEQLVQRLARVLPADLRITAVAAAPAGFHARFAATSRRYRYLVEDGPAGPDPLIRAAVLWRRQPKGRRLDVAAMNAAAAGLLGEHDFLPFARPRPGATAVRNLQRLSWSRREDGLLELDVLADAFCHHQVRFMAGALLSVGEGRRAVAWPVEVLNAGVRDSGVELVASRGLTLMHVGYPPPDALAERVASARQRRLGPGDVDG